MMSRLVPKLRFKEFSGEWEEKKLGDICEFQQGVQVDLDLQSKIPKDSYIKFLRIENYTQGSNDFRYIPLELSNNKTISKDEIAIVRYGATAGFIGTGFDGVIANNLFKLLPKEILNNKYLYYYLRLEKTFKYFQSEMAGGAMPALNFGIVGNLSLAYSSKTEQQKIANTLSSLDSLIEAQNKKVEALKEHKKGLMQQLFPSEGETVPKRRFEGFGGEWIEERLGEIGKIFKGKQLNRDTLSNNDLYPVINGGVEPSGYTNKFNKQPNIITISEGGNSCGYINFIKEKFWLGGHCYSLEDLKVNEYFLYHLLKSREIEIMRLRVGSGLPNIQKKDLENYIITITINKDEQQEIASCLSSLDNLIEAQNKKVEVLKQHKKGLMQQMFVSGEEK